MTDLLLTPIVQYGFLGFSVVLLGIVIWLISRLLEVMAENNRVLADHATAIRELMRVVSDLQRDHRKLYDKMLSRPCIAREE